MLGCGNEAGAPGCHSTEQDSTVYTPVSSAGVKCRKKVLSKASLQICFLVLDFASLVLLYYTVLFIKNVLLYAAICSKTWHLDTVFFCL